MSRGVHQGMTTFLPLFLNDNISSFPSLSSSSKTNEIRNDDNHEINNSKEIFLLNDKRRELMKKIHLCARSKIPLLLYGPMNTGKSLLIEAVKSQLEKEEQKMIKEHDNLEFPHKITSFLVNVADITDTQMLLGSYSIDSKKSFHWIDGLLTRAVRNGNWIILDNWHLVLGEISSLIDSILKDTCLLLPNGETIYKHDNFRVFLLSESSNLPPSWLSTTTLTNSNNNETRTENDKNETKKTRTRIENHLEKCISIEMEPLSWNDQKMLIAQKIDSKLHENGTLILLFHTLGKIFKWINLKNILRLCDRINLFMTLSKHSKNREDKENSKFKDEMNKIEKENSHFHPQSNSHSTLSFSSSLREQLFFECFDCFASAFKKYDDYREFLDNLGEALEISFERGMEITINRLPELNGHRIGRVNLSSPSPSPSLNSNSMDGKKAFLTENAKFIKTFTSCQILEKLAVSIQLGEPILLVGETGTGKTSMIQYLAEIMEKTLHVVNLSQQSEVSDLVGGLRPLSISTIGKDVVNQFMTLFSKTFSAQNSNQTYLKAIVTAHKEKNWTRISKIISQTVETIKKSMEQKDGKMEMEIKVEMEMEIDGKIENQKSQSKHQKKEQSSPLVDEWMALESKAHYLSNLRGISISFMEGLLLKAMKEGHWILIDELNLASKETIEILLTDLLRNKNSTGHFLLNENISNSGISNSNILPLKRHKDFRLFACMNPMTDVNKKNLSSHLTRSFVEIHVGETDNKRSDLDLVIQNIFNNSLSGIQRGKILNAYYKFKNEANEWKFVDGTGKRPLLNLRTLIRALRFAVRFQSIYGIDQAIREGFEMAFTSCLDRDSCKLAISFLEEHFGSAKRNPFSPPSTNSNTNLGAASTGKKSISNSSSSTLNSNSSFNANSIIVNRYEIPKGPLKNDINNDEKIKDKNKNDNEFISTQSSREHSSKVARVLMAGSYPILLEGPTSTGKTSLIGYLAKLSGFNLIRINNHQHTDISEYLGVYQPDPVTGLLTFREGLLVEAVRKGWWIILDELNLAPSDVLEVLNRLLDDNRQIYIPEIDETIEAHSNFRLFATQNPAGVYGGRKILSRAFRSRFIEIQFSEMPLEEIETIIVGRCRQIPPSYASKMSEAYAKILERRIGKTGDVMFWGKHAMATLRDLFKWGWRKYNDKKDFTCNGYKVIAERLRDEQSRLVVLKTLEEVFEEKIEISPLEKTSIYSQFNLNSSSLSSLIFSFPSEMSPSAMTIQPTSIMKRMLNLISEAVENNEPVLLVGETGTGKTTAIQELAHANGKELYILNLHQNTDTCDILGSLRPHRHQPLSLSKEGNENEGENSSINDINNLTLSPSPSLSSSAAFEWIDGPLIKAMYTGNWILLDEISLAQDSVLERLNSVLESDRTLTLAEHQGEIIKARDGFAIFATMNPGGDFGKRELSPALRNRFTEIWVSEGWTNREELALLINQHVCDQEAISILLEFIEWFKKRVPKNKRIVSIRDVSLVSKMVSKLKSLMPLNLAIYESIQMIFLDSLKTFGLDSCIEEEAREFLFQSSLSFSSSSLKIEMEKDFEMKLINEKDNKRESLEIPHVENDKFGMGHYWIDRNMKTCNNETNFLFNAKTTQVTCKRILRALQSSKAIHLEGLPGIGKSSIVSAIAQVIGKPLVRINLSDQTDLVDLFGNDLPVSSSLPHSSHPSSLSSDLSSLENHNENENKISSVKGKKGECFAWSDGPFLRALKNGHWILLDELNLASQSVLEGLNACLDHRGTVFIPELDREFHLMEGTVIFATQNPVKAGGGRKGLPKSFLNRFTTVWVNELDREDYRIILNHQLNNPILVDKMITFNEEMKILTGRNYNLRDLKRWSELISKYSIDNMDNIDENTENTQQNTENSFNHNKNHDKNYNLFPSSPPEYFTRLIYFDRLKVIDSNICQLYQRIFGNNHDNDNDTLMTGINDINNGNSNEMILPLIIPDYSYDSDSFSIGIIKFSQSQLNPHPFIPRTFLSAIESLSISINQSWLSILVSSCPYTFHSNENNVNRSNGPRATELITLLSSQFYENVKLLEFTAKPNMDIFDLLGNFIQSPTNNKLFEWNDGPLIKALEGGWWFHLRNAEKCPAAILDRLNELFECGTGQLILHESGILRTIFPSQRFRMFMSVDNINGLSKAMRNRGIEINLDNENHKNVIKRDFNSSTGSITIKNHNQNQNHFNGEILDWIDRLLLLNENKIIDHEGNGDNHGIYSHYDCCLMAQHAHSSIDIDLISTFLRNNIEISELLTLFYNGKRNSSHNMIENQNQSHNQNNIYNSSSLITIPSNNLLPRELDFWINSIKIYPSRPFTDFNIQTAILKNLAYLNVNSPLFIPSNFHFADNDSLNESFWIRNLASIIYYLTEWSNSNDLNDRKCQINIDNSILSQSFINQIDSKSANIDNNQFNIDNLEIKMEERIISKARRSKFQFHFISQDSERLELLAKLFLEKNYTGEEMENNSKTNKINSNSDNIPPLTNSSLTLVDIFGGKIANSLSSIQAWWLKIWKKHFAIITRESFELSLINQRAMIDNDGRDDESCYLDSRDFSEFPLSSNPLFNSSNSINLSISPSLIPSSQKVNDSNDPRVLLAHAIQRHFNSKLESFWSNLQSIGLNKYHSNFFMDQKKKLLSIAGLEVKEHAAYLSIQNFYHQILSKLYKNLEKDTPNLGRILLKTCFKFLDFDPIASFHFPMMMAKQRSLEYMNMELWIHKLFIMFYKGVLVDDYDYQITFESIKMEIQDHEKCISMIEKDKNMPFKEFKEFKAFPSHDLLKEIKLLTFYLKDLRNPSFKSNIIAILKRIQDRYKERVDLITIVCDAIKLSIVENTRNLGPSKSFPLDPDSKTIKMEIRNGNKENSKRIKNKMQKEASNENAKRGIFINYLRFKIMELELESEKKNNFTILDSSLYSLSSFSDNDFFPLQGILEHAYELYNQRQMERLLKEEAESQSHVYIQKTDKDREMELKGKLFSDELSSSENDDQDQEFKKTFNKKKNKNLESIMTEEDILCLFESTDKESIYNQLCLMIIQDGINSTDKIWWSLFHIVSNNASIHSSPPPSSLLANEKKQKRAIEKEMERKSINNNFYRNGNPNEASKSLEPIMKFSNHVRGLLELYPDHDVLLLLQSSCNYHLNLSPFATPLISYVRSIERILEKSKKWTMTILPIDELVQIVQSWRKMEIARWKEFLMDIQASFTQEARKDWIWLLKAIQLVKCNDEFIGLIETFMMAAPIGYFNARLELLKFFSLFSNSSHSTSSCQNIHNGTGMENGNQKGKGKNSFPFEISESRGQVLKTLYCYYNFQLESLNNLIENKTRPLKDSLQAELIGIKWNDKTIIGVEQSSRKGHDTLIKYGAKYKAILEIPLSSIANQLNLSHFSSLSFDNLEKKSLSITNNDTHQQSSSMDFMIETIKSRITQVRAVNDKNAIAIRHRALYDLFRLFKHLGIGLAKPFNPSDDICNIKTLLGQIQTPLAIHSIVSWNKFILQLNNPFLGEGCLSSRQFSLIQTCMGQLSECLKSFDSIYSTLSQEINQLTMEMERLVLKQELLKIKREIKPEDEMEDEIKEGKCQTFKRDENYKSFLHSLKWLKAKYFEIILLLKDLISKNISDMNNEKNVKGKNQKSLSLSLLESLECHPCPFDQIKIIKGERVVWISNLNLILNWNISMESNHDTLSSMTIIMDCKQSLQDALDKFKDSSRNLIGCHLDYKIIDLAEFNSTISSILSLLLQQNFINEQEEFGVDKGILRERVYFTGKKDSFLQSSFSSSFVSTSASTSPSLPFSLLSFLEESRRDEAIIDSPIVAISIIKTLLPAFKNNLYQKMEGFVRFYNLILNIFSGLVGEGFCIPQSSPSNEGESTNENNQPEELVDGMGMAEGNTDQSKNVSNEMEFEEQVNGLQTDQPYQDNKIDKKDKDNLDMQQDFDAKLEELIMEEDEKKDENNPNEKQDEPDEKIGQVDKKDDNQDLNFDLQDQETNQSESESKNDENENKETEPKINSQNDKTDPLKGTKKENDNDKDDEKNSNSDSSIDSNDFMNIDGSDIDSNNDRNGDFDGNYDSSFSSSESTQSISDESSDSSDHDDNDEQMEEMNKDSDVEMDKQEEEGDNDNLSISSLNQDEEGERNEIKENEQDGENHENSDDNLIERNIEEILSSSSEDENENESNIEEEENPLSIPNLESMGNGENNGNPLLPSSLNSFNNEVDMTTTTSQESPFPNTVNHVDGRVREEGKIESTITSQLSLPSPDQSNSNVEIGLNPSSLSNFMNQTLHGIEPEAEKKDAPPTESNNNDLNGKNPPPSMLQLYEQDSNSEMLVTGQGRQSLKNPLEKKESLESQFRDRLESNMKKRETANTISKPKSETDNSLEKKREKTLNSQNNNSLEMKEMMNSESLQKQPSPSSSSSPSQSIKHEKGEKTKDKDRNESEIEIQESKENDLHCWEEMESKIMPLAMELCERLKLVLTPTSIGKLEGDYRSGKRLNIRKLIQYIATDGRRDKIWMRRTGLSNRNYQICLCIDNSKSMRGGGGNAIKKNVEMMDGMTRTLSNAPSLSSSSSSSLIANTTLMERERESGWMALESTVMVANALRHLESGHVSIVSFGQETQVLKDWNQEWTLNVGLDLLSKLQFTDNRTNIPSMLRTVLKMFSLNNESEKLPLGGSTLNGDLDLKLQSKVDQSLPLPVVDNDNWKLVIIFSDGICQDHDQIRQLLKECLNHRILNLFFILDGSKDDASSILNLSRVEYIPSLVAQGNNSNTGNHHNEDDGNGNEQPTIKKRVKLTRYLEEFPFEYYTVIRDVERIPEILSETLMQWFDILK